MGLRRGEVLGLTWDDIDLHGAKLTIGRQLQRIRGQLHHRETKTDASDVSLPLPEICLTALHLHLHRQGQTAARLAAGDAGRALRWCVHDPLGTPVEPRNFFRSFVGRIERAGVRRISVHDARRTCASLRADLDVHPRIAMRILRHADFKVTMEIDTQVSSEKTQAGLKRLGDNLADG